MSAYKLSVRPIAAEDIEHITNYWVNADAAFLLGMGAEISKIPAGEDWKTMLAEQIGQPFAEKKSYCIIWEINGQAIGHCNVNKILFGNEAYMHLHVWNTAVRMKGNGAALVRMSIPYFFTDLQLRMLYCEPYALNPAPNKTLEKVGFELLKEHVTTPGFLNFEQPVKLWGLSREQYENLS